VAGDRRRTYPILVRIAMISTPFVAVPPPAYGGIELVVHALTRALERAGHEVVVFTTSDSRTARREAFFPRPVWPPDPYAELLHCRFAAREVARGSFDVVHAHLPAMLAFADELLAPTVYTLHHAAQPELSRFYAHVGGAELVAISRRQAELCDPPPAHVVHHGLEPEMYPVAGPGGDQAFFLGRLSHCKAPELAIEAARLAGLPVVVAGKPHAGDSPPGWEEESLAPALAQPHVRWQGEADLAEKRRLFASARALLVPLRWEEPFGLVMIEALLAGCPVIAMPLGAAPEIVEDGRTGFLARNVGEMAEALRRAASLDRAAIQRRGRERFSAARMAEGYLALYRTAALEARTAVLPRGADEGDRWTTLAQ
jgi:glycosyltransferase involved in cell wall biosynthesis